MPSSKQESSGKERNNQVAGKELLAFLRMWGAKIPRRLIQVYVMQKNATLMLELINKKVWIIIKRILV